jgi:hypothetical protein
MHRHARRAANNTVSQVNVSDLLERRRRRSWRGEVPPAEVTGEKPRPDCRREAAFRTESIRATPPALPAESYARVGEKNATASVADGMSLPRPRRAEHSPARFRREQLIPLPRGFFRGAGILRPRVGVSVQERRRFGSRSRATWSASMRCGVSLHARSVVDARQECLVGNRGLLRRSQQPRQPTAACLLAILPSADRPPYS